MTAPPQVGVFSHEARAVLEVAPAAILIRDAQGRLELVNEEARELLGRPVDPDLSAEDASAAVQLYVVGTNTLYPPERLPMLIALTGVECRIDDAEVRRPDKTIQLEVRASPVFGPDGQLIFAITTFADVTERRNADTERGLVEAFADAMLNAPTFGDAVRISLERIREMTGWTFGQAWMPDARSATLRCVYASSADMPGLLWYHQQCRNVSLHAGVGLPGRVWRTGEPEWLADAAVTHQRESSHILIGFPDGFNVRVAIPVSNADGVIAVLEFFVQSRSANDQRLLDRLGAVVAQVGSWVSTRRDQDLHAQQLEDALRLEREAVDRLRELRATADTVVRTVAHDLRNPIAAVLALTRMLRENAAGEHSTPLDARARMLDDVELSARRMERLLHDLVDSDPELHLGEHRRRCDVGEIVARTLRESGLHTLHPVHANIESVRIRTDAAHVERIVDNLLGNAAKHVAPGVELWVSAVRAGDGVLICVEDAGDGVPADEAEQIFEPFRRGDAMTSHGLGLGLSLVARFARLQGGRAWVEPRPGGGASFKVLLPDCASADGAAAASAVSVTASTDSAFSNRALTDRAVSDSAVPDRDKAANGDFN